MLLFLLLLPLLTSACFHLKVNVVDGLKLYEDVCGDSEVSKLVSLVNDLRTAGKRGQIQGEFTAFFNFFLLQIRVTLSLYRVLALSLNCL